MIPAGLPHRARLQGLSEHLAVYLDPGVIARAADTAHVPSSVEVIEKYSETDAVISNVGMALLAEADSKELGGQLYVDSLANFLAVHLLRKYTAAGVQLPHRMGGLSGRKLRDVTAYIAENCARDLRLDELAGVAGMSTFHFAREFKKMTGASPHQYLMKVRIERAQSLLKESTVPLIEVVPELGYGLASLG